MGQKEVVLLLVEDSAADIRLTKEALIEGKIAHDLHVVMNGVDAIRFLRREDSYGESPRPDIILLDLNLPKKDGREVLTEIKTDNDLKSIPVIVLSTSTANRDVLDSYKLQANCYIQKPVDLENFLSVIRSIEDFWLTTVQLPSSC